MIQFFLIHPEKNLSEQSLEQIYFEQQVFYFSITLIIFSPVLFDTSRIIAGSPLFLAYPTFSRNVSLTSATSPNVITESELALIGMFNKSFLFSIRLVLGR